MHLDIPAKTWIDYAVLIGVLHNVGVGFHSRACTSGNDQNSFGEDAKSAYASKSIHMCDRLRARSVLDP
jgi:hypothetical protein